MLIADAFSPATPRANAITLQHLTSTVHGSTGYPFEIRVLREELDETTNEILVDIEIRPKAGIPYAFRTSSVATQGDPYSGFLGDMIYYPNFPAFPVSGIRIQPGGSWTFEAKKFGFDAFGGEPGDTPFMVAYGQFGFLVLRLLGIDAPITGRDAVLGILEALSTIPGPVGLGTSLAAFVGNLTSCSPSCNFIQILEDVYNLLTSEDLLGNLPRQAMVSVLDAINVSVTTGQVDDAFKFISLVLALPRVAGALWEMATGPNFQFVRFSNPLGPPDSGTIPPPSGSQDCDPTCLNSLPDPPSISVSVTSAPNAAGWNNSNVSIDWTVAGASTSSGCADEIISFETSGLIRTCFASNIGGGTSLPTRLIKIDLTAPTTDHTIPAPDGKRGWHVTDVLVTLNERDPLLTDGSAGSGVDVTKYRVNGGAWQTYSGPFLVTTESLNNVVEYYSEDVADNVQATQSFSFKLDKTPPEIEIDEGETDDILWDQAHLERGILSNDPVLNIDCTATDNLDLYEVRAEKAGTDTVLDSQFLHQEPPITQSACELEIPLEPGVNTIDIIAEDCAGWEDSVQIQVVYVVPGAHDPRSVGFWSNAVKTGKYDSAGLVTLLSYTNVASDVWGTDTTRNRYGELGFLNYRAILAATERANATMEEKMKGQLLADWLNMVSGRLAVKRPVDVSRVWMWPLVMDGINDDPLTYAYRVTLEIEEKVQPAPAPFAVNAVSKNLAEGLDTGSIILP